MVKDNNKPLTEKPSAGGGKPKPNPALISYVGKEAPKNNKKRNK